MSKVPYLVFLFLFTSSLAVSLGGVFAGKSLGCTNGVLVETGTEKNPLPHYVCKKAVKGK